MVALVWNLRRNHRPSQRGHALRRTRATPKQGCSGLSRFGSKFLHGDAGLLAGTLGVIGEILALGTSD